MITRPPLTFVALLCASSLVACSSGSSGARATGVAPTGSGVSPTGSGVSPSTSGTSASGVTLRTLDRGASTGIAAASPTLVIADEQAWTDAWDEHQLGQVTPLPRPRVDFGSERVVGVFGAAGELGVAMTQVSAVGSGTLSISYVAEPGASTSRPFHFATIDDTTSRIGFQQTSVTGALTIEAPADMTFGIYAPSSQRRIRAVGGTSPYRWELLAGNLPVGLTLTSNSAEAIVGGSPQQAGSYTINLMATDAAGRTATSAVTLTAAPLQLLTVAGSTPGFAGDGLPAAQASFQDPQGVFAARSGEVYLADGSGDRIRRLDFKAGGVTTTAAGLGTVGFSGDGGLATSAQLNAPTHAAVDADGYLYVADRTNNRIRRVDPTTGLVETYAGSGPTGDDNGGFAGDGGDATAARLSRPWAVAFDLDNNLLIADFRNNRVRKVDAATRIVTTIAGGAAGFAGDGGPATTARFNRTRDLAVDRQGNLFVVDQNNHRVRRIDYLTQVVTTVAGNGANASNGDLGVATIAALSTPRSVVVDSAGNLFIAETNRIRRVDAATGVIVTVAGTGQAGLAGEGGPAAAASLSNPRGLAIHPSGALLVTTFANGEARLRVISATPATPF